MSSSVLEDDPLVVADPVVAGPVVLGASRCRRRCCRMRRCPQQGPSARGRSSSGGGASAAGGRAAASQRISRRGHDGNLPAPSCRKVSEHAGRPARAAALIVAAAPSRPQPPGSTRICNRPIAPSAGRTPGTLADQTDLVSSSGALSRRPSACCACRSAGQHTPVAMPTAPIQMASPIHGHGADTAARSPPKSNTSPSSGTRKIARAGQSCPGREEPPEGCVGVRISRPTSGARPQAGHRHRPETHESGDDVQHEEDVVAGALTERPHYHT